MGDWLLLLKTYYLQLSTYYLQLITFNYDTDQPGQHCRPLYALCAN